jgi:hypothetical protein
MLMISKIRPLVSLALWKNPIVEKRRADYRKYIPEPYKGVIIISADFELAWAWRYVKNVDDPLSISYEKARRERLNVPIILELSKKYRIPITWATVGHLFLEKCTSNHQSPHKDVKRLNYFENEWWRYNQGEWFQHDPCSDYKTAPEWYCPDLIRKILDSDILHEIGSHSFSHIDCTDAICPPDVLKSELNACAEAAMPFGVKLESFVFPGHTMGNYPVLPEMGFTSMRTNFINTIGYPVKHFDGFWEHKATMEIEYNVEWSVEYNTHRYRKIIEKTISNNSVCNLWFHPSFSDRCLEKILPDIFQLLYENKDILWVTTMKGYTDWLKKNGV